MKKVFNNKMPPAKVEQQRIEGVKGTEKEPFHIRWNWINKHFYLKKMISELKVLKWNISGCQGFNYKMILEPLQLSDWNTLLFTNIFNTLKSNIFVVNKSQKWCKNIFTLKWTLPNVYQKSYVLSF